MKGNLKKTGYTLVEMLIVVGVIAALVGVGLPAIRSLFQSFESVGGTRAMISATLASARAMAAREQRYVGIRFQKAFNPDDPLNPFAESQYMIFIIHDHEQTDYAAGFRAVRGLKPIKLPDSVGVIDLTVLADADIIGQVTQPRDATTFAIIFAPSGKLILHDVRVMRTRAGDDVFNDSAGVTASSDPPNFFQDDGTVEGLAQEMSRGGFRIYETEAFKDAYDRGVPWSGYLFELPPIHINPYTGAMISLPVELK